jgi:hypothetical protein
LEGVPLFVLERRDVAEALVQAGGVVPADVLDGYSLLGGHTLGCVIGSLWASLVVVGSLLLLRSALWYAFAALLLGVLVIDALSKGLVGTDSTDSGRLA